MRLGKDAVVFTKQQDSRSVGLLSQTYLDEIKAQTIVVPIVSWDSNGDILLCFITRLFPLSFLFRAKQFKLNVTARKSNYLFQIFIFYFCRKWN